MLGVLNLSSREVMTFRLKRALSVFEPKRAASTAITLSDAHRRRVRLNQLCLQADEASLLPATCSWSRASFPLLSRRLIFRVPSMFEMLSVPGWVDVILGMNHDGYRARIQISKESVYRRLGCQWSAPRWLDEWHRRRRVVDRVISKHFAHEDSIEE